MTMKQNNNEPLYNSEEMKNVLIAFSQKYEGNFYDMLNALKSKERLTEKEINRYLSQVEERNVTIISKHYPQALKKISNPPIVMYYNGNLGLMDEIGEELRFPLDDKHYVRCFIAVNQVEQEIDYCVGCENEKDLNFVLERLFNLNIDYPFVDYGYNKNLEEKITK